MKEVIVDTKKKIKLIIYQYSKHHRFRNQKELLGLKGMKRKHNYYNVRYTDGENMKPYRHWTVLKCVNPNKQL